MKNGITLIALVITIIVLIILAMVTIAMLTGPNGLLNKSVEAKIENSHGEVRERLQLETNAYLSEKLEGKYTKDLLTYLQEHEFVEAESNKVLIDNLSQGGKSIVTGKGTEETDIYKLEEKTEETGSTTKLASTEIVKIAETTSKEKKYSINYYDEKGNIKEIGILKDSNNSSNSDSEEEEDLIHFTLQGTYLPNYSYTNVTYSNSFSLPKNSTWLTFCQSGSNWYNPNAYGYAFRSCSKRSYAIFP